MSMKRRDLLRAGVGAAGLGAIGLSMPGCVSSAAPRYSRNSRPTPVWPEVSAAPVTPTSAVTRVSVPPKPMAPVAPAVQPISGIVVLPRAKWTRTGPNPKRVNPMNGINRITVHHEGSNVVLFSDATSTAQHLERIRSQHVGQRGWGDIGYHYIIDRSGRVWEGRALAHQGAHVRDHNPHNAGIMLLGNFNKQRPTSAQTQSMITLVRSLRQAHGVPRDAIHTHRELVPTSCPGRVLQAQVAALRQRRMV